MLPCHRRRPPPLRSDRPASAPSPYAHPRNPSRVCQKAPTVVKRKFQFCAGKIPGPLTQEEMDGMRPTFPASVQRPCSSASTHGTLYGGSEPSYNDTEEDRNVSSAAPSRAGSNTTRSLRQQDMSEALQISKRKELDMLWSSFFYEANVAFNVAKHPTFIKAVSTTAAAGFDYNPPSYNAMRTTHIKEKKKQIKAKIDERTKTSTELYGATICSDGWDNVNRRPLMNVMLVCPAGDVFLGRSGHGAAEENLRWRRCWSPARRASSADTWSRSCSTVGTTWSGSTTTRSTARWRTATTTTRVTASPRGTPATSVSSPNCSPTATTSSPARR